MSRRIDAIVKEAKSKGLQEDVRKAIENLVTSLENKDLYTSGHSERVQQFVEMLVNGLGIPAHERTQVMEAGVLHDIGKLCIDLSTLNCATKLTPEQIAMFREHPLKGREILEPFDFLSDLLPLVYHHHESFDGTGYPDGLKKDQIPLGARIITVADSYDAMTSARIYRRAMNREQAVKELKKNAGTQFDPEIVALFLEELEKME